jgi:hypothetical protein
MVLTLQFTHNLNLSRWVSRQIFNGITQVYFYKIIIVK